jgi:3-hydroxyisobutyrate dehydrogenase-like beta-hydroxyacid dehydrogenase
VADCGTAFLCLPNDTVVEEVLFSSQGLAQWIRPGSTVVETSTSGHAQTLEIDRRLAALGLRFLDAPVSGMAQRAADATLTVMCGGEAQVVEDMLPNLKTMASSVLHMGPAGSVQLANQLLYNINIAALAEIMPMACKLRLDPQQIRQVVNSGTGRSHASEYFLPRILADDFSSGYPLDNAYKDIRQGVQLSAAMGLPLPVLAAATTTYQTALLQGHGHLDKGAMIKVFEALLGVQFRSPEPQLVSPRF